MSLSMAATEDSSSEDDGDDDDVSRHAPVLLANFRIAKFAFEQCLLLIRGTTESDQHTSQLVSDVIHIQAKLLNAIRDIEEGNYADAEPLDPGGEDHLANIGEEDEDSGSDEGRDSDAIVAMAASSETTSASPLAAVATPPSAVEIAEPPVHPAATSSEPVPESDVSPEKDTSAGDPGKPRAAHKQKRKKSAADIIMEANSGILGGEEPDQPPIPMMLESQGSQGSFKGLQERSNSGRSMGLPALNSDTPPHKTSKKGQGLGSSRLPGLDSVEKSLERTNERSLKRHNNSVVKRKPASVEPNVPTVKDSMRRESELLSGDIENIIDGNAPPVHNGSSDESISGDVIIATEGDSRCCAWKDDWIIWLNYK